MKKIITLLFIILVTHVSFAGKKYWKQTSQKQGLSASTQVYMDAALTQTINFINSSSDTLYFVPGSFTGAQEDTIQVTGLSSICMMDFTGISGLTHRPLFLIPSFISFTISQNPSLANIRLGIEGTLNITCDNSGGTYTMDTPNSNIFSALGTGLINFDFGPNGGSTYLTLAKDLIAENVSMKFKGGNINVNGKKIKCKDFDAQTGPFSNSVFINFSPNSSVEATGHFKINNASSNVVFAAQTKIILNSNGLDGGSNFYHFECPSSTFSGTDLQLMNNAKYAFLTNSTNAGTFKVNNVFLGRNSQVLFGQDDTLAFKNISTNSKGSPDYTSITGGNNTPPYRSVLLDIDGGNNCLYNVKPQQLTFSGGSAFLFVIDNNANNISVPNIGFTFADNFGLTVYSANNTPVTGSAVELYEVVGSGANSQLVKVDSVTTDAFGKYKLNPGLYKNTSTYVLGTTPNLTNFPTLIPSYYKKINGRDSAVFAWEDAGSIGPGFGCGHIIDDTIHVLEQLAPTGQGQITGQITEGACFGCKVMSPLNQGGPVKGVKVGLGKNPPGAIVAFATTDNNGGYTFTGLPDGNYTVYADVPGLDLTGTHNVTIAGGGTVTTQDFVADSATIDPVGITTFIAKQEPASLVSHLQVYPNPFNVVVYLNFGEIITTTPVQVELIDVLGKVLYSSNDILTSGKSVVKTLPVNKVVTESGLYILKTQYNNQVYTTRLIKE